MRNMYWGTMKALCVWGNPAKSHTPDPIRTSIPMPQSRHPHALELAVISHLESIGVIFNPSVLKGFERDDGGIGLNVIHQIAYTQVRGGRIYIAVG